MGEERQPCRFGLQNPSSPHPLSVCIPCPGGCLLRSHQQVVRELDDLGAVPSANSTRDQLLFSVDVLRNLVPQAMDIFADCLINATICKWIGSPPYQPRRSR